MEIVEISQKYNTYVNILSYVPPLTAFIRITTGYQLYIVIVLYKMQSNV